MTNLKSMLVRIPDILHKKVKIHIAKKGISMQSWIIEIICKALRDEK